MSLDAGGSGRALANDPHRVFTREELLREVWGYRTPSRTVESHACRLRRRLPACRERSSSTSGASATASATNRSPSGQPRHGTHDEPARPAPRSRDATHMSSAALVNNYRAVPGSARFASQKRTAGPLTTQSISSTSFCSACWLGRPSPQRCRPCMRSCAGAASGSAASTDGSAPRAPRTRLEDLAAGRDRVCDSAKPGRSCATAPSRSSGGMTHPAGRADPPRFAPWLVRGGSGSGPPAGQATTCKGDHSWERAHIAAVA